MPPRPVDLILRSKPEPGRTALPNTMNCSDPDSTAAVTQAPLRRCVADELARYFAALEGETPCSLHRMVMGETEQALLEFVLARTGGNQSQAAQLLGLNRGTLRKKLQYYGIAT